MIMIKYKAQLYDLIKDSGLAVTTQTVVARTFEGKRKWTQRRQRNGKEKTNEKTEKKTKSKTHP
jgi:hypothetical protein